MNIRERENLKAKIESDLKLLADESWDSSTSDKLKAIVVLLQGIYLEGYDD